MRLALPDKAKLPIVRFIRLYAEEKGWHAKYFSWRKFQLEFTLEEAVL